VLEGTVSSIDLVPQNLQGVVSYPIRIQVQMPEGVGLLEGLSATASIVLSEEQGVLLVPTQSIYGSFEQPLVQVVRAGRVEDRPVTLGDNDGFWVVVTGGLTEGDLVVMEATLTGTNQFGGFGAFGGGRGGFGGGGFGGGGFGGGRQQQSQDDR
jgi:macrolide-specific efflux system membrane fusion protein